MSNAQRLMLDEEVGEILEAAEPDVAFALLDEAFDIQQREKRIMTLSEALRITQRQALAKVSEVARYVESIGV